MKPQSAKNKGRLLQKYVVNKLYSCFPSLGEGDIESRSMGSGGEDIMLSKDARSKIPYSFECKSVQKVAVYKWYAQAVSNSGDRDAVVVVKQNQHKPLVILDFDKFCELIKE